MNQAVFTTIAVTGFTVAFLHAAIPTHWLPFVLTARVQKWNRSKTLLVTALAGTGHVLFTAILGFLVAWGGMTLSEKVGSTFPLIAGGALLIFGLYYVIQQLRGRSHGHAHLFGGHSHEAHAHGPIGDGPRGGIMVGNGHGFIELTVFETAVPPEFRLFFYNEHKQPVPLPATDSVTIETVRPEGMRQTFVFQTGDDFLQSTSDIPEPHEFQALVRFSHGGLMNEHAVAFVEHEHGHAHEGCGHGEAPTPPSPKSDWAAIASLFTLLTFSPCEGFLPVYVSGVKYGWSGFFALTLILSLATVGGMIVFTWLTLAGFEKLKLQWLEKYESGVLGGMLCLLGLLIMLFEH
ncbi:MAG: hypothetical protein WAW39_08685 [Prosthecobacter sp.]|uniref:hypothetical protein n=1 Tax=Prosthecobacter sp. TaxID=1965333 RepID=UPI003BB11CF6